MKIYEILTEELKRIHALKEVASLLDWDEQVNLPQNSSDFRAKQASALAGVIHRESINPQIGTWLEVLEAQTDLSDDQKLVIKEARLSYEKKSRISEEFISLKAEHLSHSYHAWVTARNDNNFKLFAPYLEKNVQLAIEEASILGYTNNPYDYWIDYFDPGLDVKTIEDIFAELEKDLVPLVQDILKLSAKPSISFLRDFPVEKQSEFSIDLIKKLGFDFQRGRIDESVHPFCSGNGFDTRMTTRFFKDNPLDSLFSSIHEAGHGLYEQGLPKNHIGTVLGQAAGMAVHESQSRIWENQIARSREFWTYWEPYYRNKFPPQLQGVSGEVLYNAINSVSINPIRVDSDEVTYNLHILLRFKIEKMLFDGSIDVQELPEEWNRLSKKMLGLDIKSDKEGVLQDVHWSGGAFGYFPSYCLGNLLAAQLWYTLLNQLPTTLSDFKCGDFSKVLSWLRENVHRHGRKYNAMELIKIVTSEKLSHKYLIMYLKERYLPL